MKFKRQLPTDMRATLLNSLLHPKKKFAFIPIKLEDNIVWLETYYQYPQGIKVESTSDILTVERLTYRVSSNHSELRTFEREYKSIPYGSFIYNGRIVANQSAVEIINALLKRLN